MTLYLSKYHNENPEQTTEKIAEFDFDYNTANRCYEAEFDGIEIPGQKPMLIHISCTDPQAYLSVVVFEGKTDVFTFVAALKNYAHATLRFPSGYRLDVHIEREKLQKA